MAEDIILDEAFELWDEDTSKEETGTPVETTKTEASSIPTTEVEDEEAPIIEKAEETKEPEEEKETPLMTDGEDEENIFALNYEILRDAGALIVPEDFEFDGTEEGFLKALDVSKSYIKEQTAQELMGSFQDERARALFEYLNNGGRDLESFVQTFNSAGYEDINPEEASEEQMTAVLRDYYKRTTKLSEERIEKIVENVANAGALSESFDEAVSELKALDAEQREMFLEQQKAWQQEQQQVAEEYRKSFMDSLNKAQLPQESQQRVLQSFNPVQLEDGSQLLDYQYKAALVQQNPEHFIQFLSFLQSYDPEKGFQTATVEKRAETQAAKNLKERLRKAHSSDTRSRMGRSVTEDNNRATGGSDKIYSVEPLF